MAILKHRRLILSVALVLVLLASLLAAARCTSGKDGDPADSGYLTSGPSSATQDNQSQTSTSLPDPLLDPDTGPIALLDDPAIKDSRIDGADGIPPSDCYQSAKLYMANGPGKPADGPALQAEGTTRLDSWQIRQAPMLLAAASGSTAGLIPQPTYPRPIVTPFPVITPILIPTPTPSPLIKVLNPAAGQTLTAGAAFTLQWSVDTGRQLTFDILFSKDGGKTYLTVAEDLSETLSCKLTIPAVQSTTCIFRVNAWIGTTRFGYNVSPVFQIKAAVTPQPTASPAPSVTPEPAATPSPTPVPELVKPLPVYQEGDSLFIPSGHDAARWFKIDHDLTAVDRIVWQVARNPFSCDQPEQIGDIPGLLVQGELTGEAREFKLDFAAISASFASQPDDPATDQPVNQGESFIVKTGSLLRQTQRALYIRAILLDQTNQVIGITQSDFQIIYGEPQLDLSAASPGQILPSLPLPRLLAKTEAGFEAGAYEPIPDKGFYLYAGFSTDWQFEVGDIPAEAVTVELQIARTPFKIDASTDYLHPDGLVYRSEKAANYVSSFFPVRFSEFAPPHVLLGEDTVQYYMRAICTLPGQAPGTLIPLVTKTSPVFYTGSLALYMAASIDPPTLEPEEVIVSSHVPYTDFLRYIPVQWPLDKADEYFEVTRPIQAEEMAFYIKNNQTGDFLYPYKTHLALYPGTTRAQYQATLDRMLPPGAWFHLTIHQSGWSQFWSEFFDLLKQIYNEIRETYNSMKVTVANTVADRFAFLGSDIQSAIRQGVILLIDYGLASVGLPPSLPNFEQMADQGLDYCVQVALSEAAQQAGIPIDQIPDEVRLNITQEMKAQLASLASMKNVNPLNVGYLKPAVKAMYQPAYVDVKVFNQHGAISPSGTLTISYYPKDKPHFGLYRYTSLPVPPLLPGRSTVIRIYLKPDHTDLPVYKDYYWGRTGECQFKLTVTYDVPDAETAAAEQGLSGSGSPNPKVFVYDRSPVFEVVTIAPPCEAFYN